METSNERQESTAASGEQGQGEGAKKKRRRRRGKRREGGAAPGPNEPTDGPDVEDDGDDDGSDDRERAQPAADSASGEAPAKKKRRRKKKSAGGAQQTGTPQSDAPQTGGQQSGGQQAGGQQSGGQQAGGQQAKSGKGRDRRGRDKKESKPTPVLGRIVKTELLRDDANAEPFVPQPRQAARTVDEYVGQHKGWQREVLIRLREIIRAAGPDLVEEIKWSQPVYELDGPVCYVKAFSDHINFGFWRGTELRDNDGLLVGDGIKMRHVTIRNVNDVKRDVFDAFVKHAVKLNREKGDPTLS
jgi:hypothetical protein